MITYKDDLLAQHIRDVNCEVRIHYKEDNYDPTKFDSFEGKLIDDDFSSDSMSDIRNSYNLNLVVDEKVGEYISNKTDIFNSQIKIIQKIPYITSDLGVEMQYSYNRRLNNLGHLVVYEGYVTSNFVDFSYSEGNFKIEIGYANENDLKSGLSRIQFYDSTNSVKMTTALNESSAGVKILHNSDNSWYAVLDNDWVNNLTASQKTSLVGSNKFRISLMTSEQSFSINVNNDMKPFVFTRSMGTYLADSYSFSYSVLTKTLSITLKDLMSRHTGTRGGNLPGLGYSIHSDDNPQIVDVVESFLESDSVPKEKMRLADPATIFTNTEDEVYGLFNSFEDDQDNESFWNLYLRRKAERNGNLPKITSIYYRNRLSTTPSGDYEWVDVTSDFSGNISYVTSQTADEKLKQRLQDNAIRLTLNRPSGIFHNAYIIDATVTPFTASWLSDNSTSTTPLTPIDGHYYLIKSGGQYARKYYKWDDVQMRYIGDGDIMQIMYNDGRNALFRVKYSGSAYESEVPYDIELGAQSTTYDGLTAMRDLNNNWTMYYDDDTFAFEPLQAKDNPTIVVKNDELSQLVISENNANDMTQIHNVVEVWGTPITDYYEAQLVEAIWQGMDATQNKQWLYTTYSPTTKDEMFYIMMGQSFNGIGVPSKAIKFTAPVGNENHSETFIQINLQFGYPYKLFKPDATPVKAGDIVAGQSYIIKWTKASELGFTGYYPNPVSQAYSYIFSAYTPILYGTADSGAIHKLVETDADITQDKINRANQPLIDINNQIDTNVRYSTGEQVHPGFSYGNEGRNVVTPFEVNQLEPNKGRLYGRIEEADYAKLITFNSNVNRFSFMTPPEKFPQGDDVTVQNLRETAWEWSRRSGLIIGYTDEVSKNTPDKPYQRWYFIYNPATEYNSDEEQPLEAGAIYKVPSENVSSKSLLPNAFLKTASLRWSRINDPQNNITPYKNVKYNLFTNGTYSADHFPAIHYASKWDITVHPDGAMIDLHVPTQNEDGSLNYYDSNIYCSAFINFAELGIDTPHIGYMAAPTMTGVADTTDGANPAHGVVANFEFYQYDTEPTANVIYSTVDDANTIFYKNPYSVNSIGENRTVITPDSTFDSNSSFICADYAREMTWRQTDLVDTVDLEIIDIPWLNVTDVVEYKPQGQTEERKYYVLSKKGETTSGKSTISLAKYQSEYSWRK